MTIPDLPAVTVAHERPKTSDVRKAVEHNKISLMNL
jgi:hypothetical protein